MIVLGLDTATFTSSAALVDERGAVLAEGTLDTSGRGDDLLVLIDEVCAKAAVTPRQITAVAVGAGPGSFTGLRIGMATAKGIAFAAGCPLWLVSSLAAMAAELADRAGVDAAAAPPSAEAASSARPMTGALLVPVLDARRGEVFAGFYRAAPPSSSAARGEPSIGEVAAEQVLAPERLGDAVAAARQRGQGCVGEAASEAASLAAGETSADGETRAGGVAYSGDALEVFAEALAPLASQWHARARTPAGRWVARLALEAARAGAQTDALRSGRPAYLRPAEAEIMYPDGVPGAIRTLALPPSLAAAEPELEKP